MIKIYHDGLMISSKDNIVFFNKQINQIFDLSSDNITCENTISNNKLTNIDVAQMKKKVLSESLRKTYP